MKTVKPTYINSQPKFFFKISHENDKNFVECEPKMYLYIDVTIDVIFF
jgi:hypothetical protein